MNKKNFKHVVSRLCIDNWDVIEFVKETRDYKRYYDIMTRIGGMTMAFVPSRYQTQKMVEVSVRRSHNELSFAKTVYKTEEVCIEAVKQNGWAIVFVPEDKRTKEVVRAAFLDSGSDILKMIPKSLLSDTDFLVELAKVSRFTATSVADIPVKYWNEELCKQLLQANAIYYIQLPKNMRTVDLTLWCVSNDIPVPWSYLPREIQTKDFCEKIVELRPKFIAMIPRKFITQSMVNKALKSDPGLIKYIDNKFKTEEICKESVKANPSDIFFVPDSKCSYDMWLSFAIRVEDYEEVAYFPEKLLPQIKLELRRINETKILSD